jgi:hypothetical protein
METMPTTNTAELSDDELFDLAAREVSRPKSEPADSFRLHAPLELLARRTLLERVDIARRAQARERILWVADTYTKSGGPSDAATDGAPPRPDPDAMVASLAAAGHASIFFSLLPRVAAHSPGAISLLRPLAIELERYPDWKVEWVDDSPLPGAGDEDALTRALLATPRLGLPGSDFIFPIVHQVDANDVARSVIEPVVGASSDLPAAARVLARVAAWSMLQDNPAQAPYGWTHCLTLPQAIANIAHTTSNPTRAVAIAATHTVGFRAALSSTDVTPGYAPEPVEIGWLAALDASPRAAAAAVHHAPPADIAEIKTELATRAALHADAHVVKYTLACFDAADADPDHERLFLSAAAFLHGWWARTGA